MQEQGPTDFPTGLLVRMDQVVKSYAPGRGARVRALDGLSLDVRASELLSVVGPTGSGKTTLLRVLANLEAVDSGRVLWRGKDREAAPKVAMVFQSASLYPHLDVAGNIEFGLRLAGIERAGRKRRLEAIADALGLASLLSKRTDELSGGEQQRIALARALVIEPELLLLDEPFSSFDPGLRSQMRLELVRIHRELGITTICVTHDQMEAMALGDRLAVLNEGRVVQCAAPAEVYRAPKTLFAAKFLGSPEMNLLPGQLKRDGGQVRFLSGAIEWLVPPETWSGWDEGHIDGLHHLGIRPEAVALFKVASSGGDAWTVEGMVRAVEFQGACQIVHVEAGGVLWRAWVRGGTWDRGDRAVVSISAQDCLWFDAAGRTI